MFPSNRLRMRARKEHDAQCVALARSMMSRPVPMAACLVETPAATLLAQSRHRWTKISTACAAQTALGPRRTHSPQSPHAEGGLPDDRPLL